VTTNKKTGCSRPLMVLLLLVGIAALGWGILFGAGKFLIYTDKIKKVDVAVVLSGGSDLSRLNEAVRLYHEGYVTDLLLTETGGDIPALSASYTELLKTEAMNQGVPDDAVLVTDKTVRSTYEEARAVLSKMQRDNIKSCIVVTDPYHSRRARIVFTDVFRGSGMTVRITPVRGHWYTASTWWTSSEGWNATIYEYVKMAAFVFGIKKG